MIYASYSFDEHETLMKLFDNEAVYIDSSANFVDISKDYALKCVTYWINSERERKRKKNHFIHQISYGLSACVCPSCKNVYGSLDSYWKWLNENLTDTYIYSMDYNKHILSVSLSLSLSQSISLWTSSIYVMFFLCVENHFVSDMRSVFGQDQSNQKKKSLYPSLSVILNVSFGLYLIWLTGHNSSTINM